MFSGCSFLSNRFLCFTRIIDYLDYNHGRISTETCLADNTKICYTYDSLNRVTKRSILNECDEVISEENYAYDSAGNIIDAPDSCFTYDTNNRLIDVCGNAVAYDADGNMLSVGESSPFEYDSANRLVKAGDHAYTYNAEDVRIRNLCGEYDTTYTYNTNVKLSQLLMKTTNSIVTKYVYGLGLIGEDKLGVFKTYHFDYRGSTVAITDIYGNITDTFKYDTYGRLLSRTGDSFVIFGYNGRDGVVTDKNGLIYMRARYYSPELRRFINADIIHGEISDSASLNRYAYVNGNPVSYVDPFGLCKDADRGSNREITVKTLKRVVEMTDYDLIFQIKASAFDGKWIDVQDPQVELESKTEENWGLITDIFDFFDVDIDVHYFYFRLKDSDLFFSFDEDNIMLEADLQIQVYLKIFDCISIPFHTLEMTNQIYWGKPE